MNKSKRSGNDHAPRRRTRAFRAGLFGGVLLVAGVATAVAGYVSPSVPRSVVPASVPAAAAPANGFVTVEVGGKKLRVNAQTLQQGPLSPAQSQQIADALKDNKSTQGLVEVRHADGSVEMNLEGRFQNVTIAKRNDDGSVSTACVDTPEAATSFLNRDETAAGANGSEAPRKAPVKE